MFERAADEAVLDLEVLAAAEGVDGLLDVAADEEDVVAVARKAHAAVPGNVVEDAEHADDGRRVDGAVSGLVVEADVAGDDGSAECVAGVGDALDDCLHLEVDLRAAPGCRS